MQIFRQPQRETESAYSAYEENFNTEKDYFSYLILKTTETTGRLNKGSVVYLHYANRQSLDCSTTPLQLAANSQKVHRSTPLQIVSFNGEIFEFFLNHRTVDCVAFFFSERTKKRRIMTPTGSHSAGRTLWKNVKVTVSNAHGIALLT